MIETWAIIPSRSRRPELESLVTHLVENGVQVVVADNGYEPPLDASLIDVVIRCDEQPPNLSRMWNLAFDAVEKRVVNPVWNVLVLNDDAVLPAGWIGAVTHALRAHDVVAACSDTYHKVRTPTIYRERDGHLWTRMCPWAFVLRGEVGLRADETLRWHWGDTDVDWQARDAGGLVIIPGYWVGNTYANSTTVGELAVQAGRDRETFGRKWGVVPW